MSNYLHSLARIAAAIFVMAFIAASALHGEQSSSKKPGLVIRAAKDYVSHQNFQGLTIAARPYNSNALCNEIFEYKNLISKGILPVLVVVENHGKSPVRIEGRSIYLTTREGTYGDQTPLEFREVLGQLRKVKVKSGFPIPIPGLGGKYKALSPKLDQLRSRAFGMKLVPPSQKDYGFVYYRLPDKEFLRDVENIYLPQITNMETNEELIFFELDLREYFKSSSGTGLSSGKPPLRLLNPKSPPSLSRGYQPLLLSFHSSKGSPMRQPALPGARAETPNQGKSSEEKPILIPRKSEIVVSLLSFISTRSATAGDKFYGQVAIPVIVGNRIVLPVNSYIIGTVKRAKRAGRIRGKAELELNFKSVILPNGETRTIEARIRAAEGYKSDEIRKSEGTIEAEPEKGKDLEEGAKNASIGATLGAIVIGSAARSGRGLAYGGIGGAATGLGLTLLKRGSDVELQKGTQLTLVLERNIQLTKTKD